MASRESPGPSGSSAVYHRRSALEFLMRFTCSVTEAASLYELFHIRTSSLRGYEKEIKSLTVACRTLNKALAAPSAG